MHIGTSNGTINCSGQQPAMRTPSLSNGTKRQIENPSPPTQKYTKNNVKEIIFLQTFEIACIKITVFNSKYHQHKATNPKNAIAR